MRTKVQKEIQILSCFALAAVICIRFKLCMVEISLRKLLYFEVRK